MPKIDIEPGVIKPVSSLLINKYLMRYRALFHRVLRLIVVYKRTPSGFCCRIGAICRYS